MVDQVAPGLTWHGVEHQWWYNSINEDSHRLTSLGFKWIKKNTKLKLHEIDLQEKILPKQMLQLERLLHEPYYIHTLKKIYVFSEQDAVMLQLHGGDLVTYLNNLQQNQ
jgi:CRISPR/Cas system-associated endonuclease/helicase Cas3